MKKLIASFVREDDGTIAILFGLTIVTIFLMAGLSVDYGRGQRTKVDFQQIADSAAIYGGREYQLGANKDAVKLLVESFIDKLLIDKGYNPDEVTADVDVMVASSSISVNLSTTQDTAIMQIANQRTMDIGTGSTVGISRQSDGRDLEVAVMLDVTGSMGDIASGATETKMEIMQYASKELVDIVLGINNTVDDANNRVALVPFAHAVNVGDYFETVTGRTLADSNTWKDACYVTDAGDLASLCTNNPGWAKKEFSSCVVERPGNAFEAGVPALTSAYFAPFDERRGDGGRAKRKCMGAYSEIVPLTRDRDVLKDQIDLFEAYGHTAGHLGTAWTGHLLDPDWLDVWPTESKPSAYDDDKVRKVAILMTDGIYNTQYNGDDGVGTSAEQAVQLCTDMKAAGLEIYTVGYELNDADVITMLKSCATSEDHHYFLAMNKDELVTSFRSIGFSLTDLAVVR